ncbi:putative reverse transcriptase domain-containing protein [Tanacetum coccineum]
MNKKDNREDKTKKGSVFSNLARKITNIDRKMIGKDGKPLRVVRRVVFQEPISVAEVSEADQACVQNVSNTPSHPVVDKSVERIVEDVSTDVDVSDALRSDCNNDGSSGEAANIDKNAASGNVNGISQQKEGSFASLLRPKEVTNKLRFRTLVNKEKVECFDCVLPKAAANLVKSRYENSIVGFFVGKDPTFPVVQNYVLNIWSKFGFEKIARNDNGVYLFKFASKAGLEQVLERGPWMTRKSPIILNKRSFSVSLKKGEVTKVPVWVKLYNVPFLAYSEDGLSLIATHIGKPVMLDAFTSFMCVESWGRINFSRALIEISSASTLMKEVIMAIPEEEGDGHIKEVIRVEYEWKPPHCVECKSFGHSHDICPKRVRDEVPKALSMAVKPSTMEDNEEGFVEVKRRNKNKGDASRSFGGIRLPKPNSKVHWEPKKSVDSKGGSNTTSPSGTTKESDKGVKVSSPSRANQNMTTPLSNSFDLLNMAEKEDVQNPKVSDHDDTKLEDESDDDEVYMPHGGGFTDGMEDDLECYDGYGTHVYDLTPPEQAFCHQYDIRLNSRGRK